MKLIREDRTVGWIVLVFALSQLIAIGWDLPGSYGWENDGIAPLACRSRTTDGSATSTVPI